MKLFDHLRRLGLQYRADQAIRRGDGSRAAEILGRLEETSGLSSVHEAQLATALLWIGQPHLAQFRFASLQKKMGSDPEERYVQKYCRYYLALMRDERSQADYEWRLAQSITPKPKCVKRLTMERVVEKARPGVVATLSLGDAPVLK